MTSKRFRLETPFEPAGDQDAGHRAAGRRGRGRARLPDPARRHRLGQDLHHGQGGRDHQPADPGAVPQQDPGGAALPGVQGVLPVQRRRVLRLVLRLLPARGLCPVVGHLHREGDLDQRGDRPAPAVGYPLALRAPRCAHRRLGELHLRSRFAGGLLQHAPALRSGRRAAHGGGPAPARQDAVRAHQPRSRAGQLPAARRCPRDLPALRRHRGEDLVLG